MKRFFKLRYANTVDSLYPEHWANEGLLQVENSMVMGNLVHRDYSSLLAKYGDVVNADKPADFVFKRKTNTDAVSVQNAVSTSVPVTLNQWGHVSFLLKDDEMSKSFRELVEYFLVPGMRALADGIDRTLIGLAPQFTHHVGYLGKCTSSTIQDYLVQLDKRANDAKWPMSMRQFVMDTATRAAALNTAAFTTASTVGDQGQALAQALIGEKYGFKTYMDQNTPRVSVLSADYKTAAINNVGGYAAGTATALAIDGLASVITTGSYVTIVGSEVPYRVASSTVNTTSHPNTVTLDRALEDAVLNDAIVTIYKPCLINHPTAGTYAKNFATEIAVDTFASGKTPQVGQLVSIGTYTYTIIQIDTVATTSCRILLDRPLDEAAANDSSVFPGPIGSYNLGFLKGAIALVSRPLALPPASTGVRGAVVNYNNLSMRCVMTYDGTNQGVLVTLDTLYGVVKLDDALGCVVYG